MDFVQNELGIEPEDAIPGLMGSIVVMALMTSDPHQALNEAVDLLEFEEGEEVTPGETTH